MSAGTPISGAQITGITPSAVEPQSTEDVLIIGASTNFDQDTTTVSFGPDIVVNSVDVARPTLLIANITVASTAAAGPRDVTVTTGAETVTLSGKFTVLATSATTTVKPTTAPPPTPQQYSVLINLSSIANPPSGDVWNIVWFIDGKLLIAVNPADHMLNPPYLPTFQDGTFSVRTAQFLMQAPDGTAISVVSPMNYTVSVGTPDLDLTNRFPVLSFCLVQPIPNETLEAKGQIFKACIFGGMLQTVVATNNITLPQVQAMTGNTSDGVSGPVDTAALAAEGQALQAATAGDPAAATDPSTQAAVLSLVRQAVAGFSIPASQAPSLAQIGAAFAGIRAPWKYGSPVPVHQKLSFNQGGLQIAFAIYIAVAELDD